ncbi:hypothetical protein NFI96_000814 [Prochilodus magdalenae]|nr:hypothetical protein NFI96_000814 [Prochilodus magdalenae]
MDADGYRVQTGTVLIVESVVGFGEVLLAVLAMPHFDIITNVMILNSVSIMSAVLQIVAECLAKERKRFIIIPVSAIFFIILGYVLFVVSYVVIEGSQSPQVTVFVGLAIVGTLCVSLNWWENYITLFKTPFLEEISKDIVRSRNVVSILSALVKVLITAVVLGASVPPQSWLSLKSIPVQVSTTVFGLVAVQIVSSAMCRWFVVVACKMHALRRCFLVPMYVASVVVLLVFLIPFDTFYQKSGLNDTFCESGIKSAHNSTTLSTTLWLSTLIANVRNTLCARSFVSKPNTVGLVVLGIYSLSWWLGLMLSTVYIWSLKIQRIERTQDLFTKQMFEGAFLEQSMLLNTHFEIRKKSKEAQ